MKLLFLYGVNCTRKVWDRIIPYLSKYEIDFVEYKSEWTKNACSVEDLTRSIYEEYGMNKYDAVVGHSLGGIVALQLAHDYGMNFGKIIYLDTNLKPAEAFYRNLMTPEHMEQYGEEILSGFATERGNYTEEMFNRLREDFDYSYLVNELNQVVYGLYGDRNRPDYPSKTEALNLDEKTLCRLKLSFIPNACHMIMIENPVDLSNAIKAILEESEKIE